MAERPRLWRMSLSIIAHHGNLLKWAIPKVFDMAGRRLADMRALDPDYRLTAAGGVRVITTPHIPTAEVFLEALVYSVVSYVTRVSRDKAQLYGVLRNKLILRS